MCASFGSTRLIGASSGSTRLMCASFGSTKLICASFGSTGLICAFYGTTRLLCRAPPNRKLTVVRARLGADRRGAERMREGHMDVSDFIFASAADRREAGRTREGHMDASGFLIASAIDLSLVRKVGSLHAVSERVGHATMDDRRRSVDDAITRRATTLRGWVHSCGAARLAMTADGKLGGTAGLHSRRRGRKGPRLASAWLRRTTGCSRRRRGD
ncbi:hypothetical protein E6C27_scaffold9392G00030 [Cucumis melo var. makuwa]|uniref:Uncharacterized protein n=1 Tax=Cucumis melo var. makuwa TaxID=1194695 RepID=A0A5A7TPD6_CUCMM|nr:hypothetical protein E6C27_scaffold9392G00030 [Cucumis melo var. makuwa]